MTTEKNISISQSFKDLLKITPSFSSKNDLSNNFQAYIYSIEMLINDLIFKDFFLDDYSDIKKTFLEIEEKLPIIDHSPIETISSSFSLICLSLGDHIEGIERFMPDMISRWLIPGKHLQISGHRSLLFEFQNFPKKKFYVVEYFVNIDTEKELLRIQKNIDHFINELRINILSVYHAREILSKSTCSFKQKNNLIKENISSLMKIPKKNSAFDQMQNFITKLSEEKKVNQIRENIYYLMHKRPKTFDQDIFDSMHNDILLFRDRFTQDRDARHISRVISFIYLFKKVIKQILIKAPHERHVQIKLFKTRINSNNSKTSVLGMLITINFLNEAELFEKNHLFEALCACIENINKIKGSFIIDRRDDKIKSYYLEIEKKTKCNFSPDEAKKIKKQLAIEIKQRITNVLHPIFMPRNEEEILRNIILLSKQLKYVKDLPQLIITYDKQTVKEISFTVILVRLIKTKTTPLKELFSYSDTFLKFSNEEIKVIGKLKRKYPKEANVFKLSLKKEPFFRKDFSLDLQKARQILVMELSKIIGDFRDYNGGMILKQSEALNNLKYELSKKTKDHEFLIENFFYSIKPAIMQSILDSSTIKDLFLLLLETIKIKTRKKYIINLQSEPKYYLLVIRTEIPSLKDHVLNDINKLKISSFDLTTSYLEINKLSTLSFIYRTRNSNNHKLFYETVKESLKTHST
jgi:hypothetical protein